MRIQIGNHSITPLQSNNTSIYQYEDYEDTSHKELYLQLQFATGLFCYPLVCFVGLTGNVISIMVLSQRKMRTSTNCYLIALAVADSIKLFNDSIYFLTILLLHIDPPTGVACYGYLYPYAHYLFSMSVCVTAWLTVSVAAERYVMVSEFIGPGMLSPMGYTLGNLK